MGKVICLKRPVGLETHISIITEHFIADCSCFADFIMQNWKNEFKEQGKLTRHTNLACEVQGGLMHQLDMASNT